MKENGHNMEFEEFFRQSFDGAELTPTNKVWENIEQQLDQHETPRYQLGKWWLSGMAAAVLLAFFAYLLLWNPMVKTYSASSVTITTHHNTAQHGTTKVTAPTTKVEAISTEDTKNNIGKVQKNNSYATPKQQSVIGSTIAKNTIQTSKVHLGATNKRTKEVLPTSGTTQPKTTANSKQTNKIVAAAVTNTVLVGSTNEPKTETTPTPQITTLSSLVTPTLQPLSIDTRLKGELLPLVIVGVPNAAQVAILSQEQSRNWWIGLTGGYSQYNPNFSGIQDSITPNPYLRNTLKQGLYVYEGNSFTKDLQQLQGSTLNVGVQIGRKLWKGLSIQSGVSYTESNFSFEKDIVVVIVSNYSSIRTFKFSNTTQQLGVPLSLQYQYPIGKVLLGGQLGVQTDFLLQNTMTNDKAAEGHTFSVGTYRQLQFSSLLGVHLGYTLTPRISLLVEGNYKQSLGSVYDSRVVESMPMWLGINTSLRYKF